MAEPHVVTALTAKHTEMAGLIEHHKKAIAQLSSDMTHVDATLKLFGPELDLRTLRPKEHRERNRYFLPGECQRMVLEIFRDAAGAALCSRQIGEALVARRGLDPSPALIVQMQKNAIAVVRHLERSATLAPARP